MQGKWRNSRLRPALGLWGLCLLSGYFLWTVGYNLPDWLGAQHSTLHLALAAVLIALSGAAVVSVVWRRTQGTGPAPWEMVLTGAVVYPVLFWTADKLWLAVFKQAALTVLAEGRVRVPFYMIFVPNDVVVLGCLPVAVLGCCLLQFSPHRRENKMP